MIRRRRPGRGPGDDRGSFTAELAVGLPALMMLLFAGLTAMQAVSDKGGCVDAARAGALAASRGDRGEPAAARVAPRGAEVEVAGDAATVTVRVRARVRLLGPYLAVITVEGAAVAAREPGDGGEVR